MGTNGYRLCASRALVRLAFSYTDPRKCMATLKLKLCYYKNSMCPRNVLTSLPFIHQTCPSYSNQLLSRLVGGVSGRLRRQGGMLIVTRGMMFI
jgi:hypothetical protein